MMHGQKNIKLGEGFFGNLVLHSNSILGDFSYVFSKSGKIPWIRIIHRDVAASTGWYRETPLGGARFEPGTPLSVRMSVLQES